MTDDPTGWFEPLYAAAARGERSVPWERDEPREALVEWAEARGLDGRGLGERLRRLGCFAELLQLVARVQVVVAVLALLVPPPLRGVPSVQPHVVEAGDVRQRVLSD